jgi:hypothetical protein
VSFRSRWIVVVWAGMRLRVRVVVGLGLRACLTGTFRVKVRVRVVVESWSVLTSEDRGNQDEG